MGNCKNSIILDGVKYDYVGEPDMEEPCLACDLKLACAKLVQERSSAPCKIFFAFRAPEEYRNVHYFAVDTSYGEELEEDGDKEIPF